MTAYTPRGYNDKVMDKTFSNRMSRLEGQLKKLNQSIANGDDCSDVIPQFLAVKGAVSGALNEYLKHSIAHCKNKDAEKMNKIIAMLTKV